jgi:hypothetical protein
VGDSAQPTISRQRYDRWSAGSIFTMAASILPWTHHHCWRMDPAPTQSQAGRSPPKRQAVRRGNNVHLVLGSVHTPNNQDDRLISLMVEARQTNDLLLASMGDSLDAVAASAGHSRKHFSRLVRLAHL